MGRHGGDSDWLAWVVVAFVPILFGLVFGFLISKTVGLI